MADNRARKRKREARWRRYNSEDPLPYHLLPSEQHPEFRRRRERRRRMVLGVLAGVAFLVLLVVILKFLLLSHAVGSAQEIRNIRHVAS